MSEVPTITHSRDNIYKYKLSQPLLASTYNLLSIIYPSLVYWFTECYNLDIPPREGGGGGGGDACVQLTAQYMGGPGLLCTVRNCSVDSLAAAVRVKVGDILQ